MSPIVLSAGIFLLTVGGIFLGSLLRDALPRHHLNKDTQDVVRLGVGLVATMAALVVGLLIAAAKNSFDTQSGQVRQITADVVLLDNLLAQYGPEAAPLRAEIRTAIPLFADRLWSEKASDATARYEPNVAVEKVYIEIQSLAPQNDLQRSLQARAIAASTDIAQARLLLFTEKGNSIPLPFLGVLALWLIIIFASFSLFSSLNATVFISLALFALSSSCAIYLILELGRPFTGLMMISSAPLREALGPLSP
ncbi:MAG: hypothetical protein ABSE50_09520 [Xanthobacteraceae bacterium]|jgi:hypothetical protein